MKKNVKTCGELIIELISHVAIYEEPLNEFVHGDADLMLIFYGVILMGTADTTVSP